MRAARASICRSRRRAHRGSRSAPLAIIPTPAAKSRAIPGIASTNVPPNALEMATAAVTPRAAIPAPIDARATARVENLAQLNDETFPLLIGEPAIEIDRSSHADRESEERPRRGAKTHIIGSGSLRDRIGRNADLAADRLELGERQPFVASNLTLQTRGPFFRRRAEDRGDLFVVVASLGHALI